MDIQTVLDKEEIKELRYSFAWNLETSKPDDLADLFTVDGIIDVGPWGKMVGQDAIRRGYGKAYSGQPEFTAMHAVTNPRIFVDGDEATGTWYLLDCSLREPKVNPITIIGIYNEKYRRVDGKWKISYLNLQFLWSSEHGHITEDNPMTIPQRVKEGYKADRQSG